MGAWASQNGAKIVKNNLKNDAEKTYVLERDFWANFNDFDLPKSSQNWAFSATFWKTTIWRKLTKTIEKPMVFIDFSWFDPPKNDPKSIKNRVRKKYRKRVAKNSILGWILEAFWGGFRSKCKKKYNFCYINFCNEKNRKKCKKVKQNLEQSRRRRATRDPLPWLLWKICGCPVAWI